MFNKALLVTSVLLVGLLPSISQAQGNIDLSTADYSSWTLFGSAVETTTPTPSFLYRNIALTSPGQGASGGAAFAPDAITLNLNQSFSFNFNFFIAAGSMVRGDGLAFVLASNPGLGNAGSGLGYEGLDGVAFAVDTFHFDGEPISPSLQVLADGSTTPLSYTETGLGDDIRATDFQWTANVVYTPSGSLDEKGSFSGSITHPTLGTFSVSAEVDLSLYGTAIFDPENNAYLGRSFYYGFTASNGLADDGHFVTSATPTAVPEPDSYALMLTGIALMGFISQRRS